MESLKIHIPKGYQIDSFDQLSGEIKFKEKPRDVIDRIKCVEDALRELGDNDEDVIVYKKLSELFDHYSHIVNYHRAIVLVKAMNEGWVPDWDNSNEIKYSIFFDMRGSSGFRFVVCASWYSYSSVGSRLCLKEKRLGEYLGTQFTAVFKQFMTIKK